MAACAKSPRALHDGRITVGISQAARSNVTVFSALHSVSENPPQWLYSHSLSVQG